MVNKIEAIINTIKVYNIVTDMDIYYNMDRKSFIIKDRIDNKLIRGVTFDLKEFQEFIQELNKLSLWDSDYEMRFQVIKN